jgi:hypothetical protein
MTLVTVLPGPSRLRCQPRSPAIPRQFPPPHQAGRQRVVHCYEAGPCYAPAASTMVAAWYPLPPTQSSRTRALAAGSVWTAPMRAGPSPTPATPSAGSCGPGFRRVWGGQAGAPQVPNCWRPHPVQSPTSALAHPRCLPAQEYHRSSRTPRPGLQERPEGGWVS